MDNDIKIIITIDENGNLKLSGKFAILDLIVACDGLVMASARCLGVSKIEYLETMLKGEKLEN